MGRRPVVRAAGSVRVAVQGMSTRTWWFLYGAAAALYVIFCLHQPLSMNAYAGHDDMYFVSDAQSMLAGHWLGDFNQLTLIKGPGFTYFLVLNHRLGLSLSLSLAVVYAVACVTVTTVVRRVAGLVPAAAFGLFLLLLWQPAVVPNRVIRDAFYHSLFLFVVAGVVAVAFLPGARGRVLRAILTGAGLGWFWITREEGPWILGGVIVLLVVQSWRHRRAERRDWLLTGLAVVTVVLVAAVPVLATSAVNKEKYGAFTVTDLASGSYRTAVGQLDRIEAGPELPRVPVSRKALAAAYRVSPAARELKPFLNGAGGKNWGVPTCQLYPKECGELAGGWFGWALRDAAAAAGHYRSGTEAGRFFAALARQIADACSNGSLTCHTNPLPLVPVMTRQTLLDLPGAVVHAAKFTTYDEPPPPSAPSVGPRAALDQTADLLGDPLLSRTVGHGFGSDGTHWLGLKVDLTRVYRVIMPVLLLAGLVALFGALFLRFRRRAVDADTLVLAVFLWIVYVSRLGLIAVVDVTAAPAVNGQYLEPAFLALTLAGFVSIVALISGLRSGRPVAEPQVVGQPELDAVV